MGALLGLALLVIVGLVVGSILLHIAVGLVGWLLIGLVAGLLASYLVKDRSGRSLLSNMVLGIFGSFVSGFLLHVFHLSNLDDSLIGNLFFSTIGAIIIITVGRFFTDRNRNRNTYRVNNRY